MANHNVKFEEACEVFFDPFWMMIDASRDFERRDGIIGYDKSSRLLFVVFVEKKDDAYRIVSARKADKEHRRYYENY